MTAYALIHDGAFKSLVVKTAGDLKGAEALVAASKRIAGQAIEVEADLASFSGPSLVALYNALGAESGTPPVSRFTTRGDGARRCFTIIEEKYRNQPTEVAAEASSEPEGPADNETNEEGTDDMAKAKKTKKAPKAKVVRIKKERVAKGPRVHKSEVKSKGGEASKATALEMIKRANGATAEQIAERLEVSIGTAKNLVWYLRRDGKKIVLDRKTGVFSI